jgi:uncharacterized protein YjbI with pentapeptide repeats
MRRQHQRRLAALAFAAVLGFSLAAHASAQVPRPSPEPAQTNQQKLSEEKLREEVNKLREEVNKLQLENKKLQNPWERILSFGTLVTALVALGGFLVTFWKQMIETSRQRILDCEQRDRESRQRADGLRVRLEEQFNGIVSNLGSESPSVQASAAIQIMNFLKPEHQDFHNQVFLILNANLKVQLRNVQDEVLAQLLVDAFQQAIRIEIQADPDHQKTPIDLARTYLKRAELFELDLRSADLAFADLRNANLKKSNLHRARGIEAKMEKARLSGADLGEARMREAILNGAQFHGTNLVSADLKKTELKEAEFQKAKLQSAHLEGADLTDARFEQANLNDAFFQGATFSPITLRSIINAVNWEKAHYDAPVLASLRKLAADRANRKPKGAQPQPPAGQ